MAVIEHKVPLKLHVYTNPNIFPFYRPERQSSRHRCRRRFVTCTMRSSCLASRRRHVARCSSRALSTSRILFRQIIPDHELFNNEENIAKVFALLPPGLDALKTQLLKRWSEEKSSPVEKWNQFALSVARFLENKRKGPQLQPIEEIVFTYTWPRLDANVSKGAHWPFTFAMALRSHRRPLQTTSTCSRRRSVCTRRRSACAYPWIRSVSGSSTLRRCRACKAPSSWTCSASMSSTSGKSAHLSLCVLSRGD